MAQPASSNHTFRHLSSARRAGGRSTGEVGLPFAGQVPSGEFTLGSLFAGIGGMDLGFERAGFKTVWQVEINDYCRKVLAKNFPHAERYEDVRECGIHNLIPVDVICGGFPCQDISNAGLRAGIEGERSGLWKEFARIIRELRPRFVLVENVAALLGRGMGVVLGDLAAIGYDAEWEVISAADVGAPHLRERIWIISYPADSEVRPRYAEVYERAGAQVTFGFRDFRSHVSDSASRCGQSRSTSGDEWGLQNETMRRMGNPHNWKIEPNVGRVAHGVPKRVDRLRGLGNAVVPQIPEMIAHRIREALEAA